MNLCDKKYNEMRKSWNHCLGSTTYAGITPKFMDPELKTTHMLPRPYRIIIENYILISRLWIRFLISDCADVTLSHLETCKNIFMKKKQDDLLERVTTIIADILFCISEVPLDLRVYDTFFTQATIIGSVEDVQHYMPIHLDKCDKLSCLVIFGECSGGSTGFYNGISPNDKNELVLNIPFLHGRIIIGTYCSLLHDISNWKGVRMSLSLNLKRKVIDHFRKYGNRFYKQYKEEKYPRRTRLYK